MNDAGRTRDVAKSIAARPRPARYAPTPWAQQRLYRPFARAAFVVALGLGFSLGAATAVATSGGPGWTAIVRLHGMTQIFGWGGLFVMGIAMHAVPRFRGNAPIRFPWPQRVVFVLIVGAIALRAAAVCIEASAASTASTVDEVTTVGGLLLMGSGAALLGGATVFAWTLAGPLRGGTASLVPVERWIWAGLAFAVVAAALHAALMIALVAGPLSSTAASLDRAFVTAGLFGFLGNFVFGMSLRTVAAFLGLRPRHARVERAAFVLLNVGTAMMTLTMITDPRWLTDVGTLFFATGGVAFFVALRIAEPRTPPPDAAREEIPYGRFAWFLFAGYGWLLVAALLLVGGAIGDLARVPLGLAARPAEHVFALGFVTMTMFGFGARVLPLFEGRALRHPMCMDAAFVLLNSAVVLRVGGSGWAASWASVALGASGLLALGAIGCFALSAWPRGRTPSPTL